MPRHHDKKKPETVSAVLSTSGIPAVSSLLPSPSSLVTSSHIAHKQAVALPLRRVFWYLLLPLLAPNEAMKEAPKEATPAICRSLLCLPLLLSAPPLTPPEELFSLLSSICLEASSVFTIVVSIALPSNPLPELISFLSFKGWKNEHMIWAYFVKTCF